MGKLLVKLGQKLIVFNMVLKNKWNNLIDKLKFKIK